MNDFEHARVFVVPDRSPFEGDLQDIHRLPARAIDELEKFFEATDALESKKLEFLGWRGPAKAIKTIKKVAGTVTAVSLRRTSPVTLARNACAAKPNS